MRPLLLVAAGLVIVVLGGLLILALAGCATPGLDSTVVYDNTAAGRVEAKTRITGTKAPALECRSCERVK